MSALVALHAVPQTAMAVFRQNADPGSELSVTRLLCFGVAVWPRCVSVNEWRRKESWLRIFSAVILGGAFAFTRSISETPQYPPTT